MRSDYCRLVLGFGLLGALGLAAFRPAPAAAAQGPANKVRLVAEGENRFTFETDQIEGAVCLEGKYHGVTRLADKRTGRPVIDPRYSALNLFKLMSTNLCMGQPRDMPRTVSAGQDWVEATWAATDAHAGQVVARYEVRQPNLVDLTVTVRVKNAYPGYEVFLSSYFDKVLRPQVYLKTRDGKSSDLVVPMLSDVFRGTVLVFPRDSHAARPCLDGRWDRREGPTPCVQMCPVRHYALCRAMLTDPEKRVGVALMSDPRCCYAFSTRYWAENDADRLTTYNAFDLSLVGGDLVPGDERTARVRLALLPPEGFEEQAQRLYREFLERPEQ